MSEPKEARGKPFPVFYSDEEATHFLETADLSEYDFSGFRPVKFDLQKKDARMNLRLPQSLLTSVKDLAAKEDVPYQRLMRDLIERGLADYSKARSLKAPRKKAS